ncbi:MAG: putative bifunctional diguanylate cyclase/phosphodiesterase [Lachnospiraceae bacterium]
MGLKSMEEKDNKTKQGMENISSQMTDEGKMELYLYSLRKMAENNLESNRTFMTGLYNLRAFLYKAAEEMLQNPDMKFALIVMDLANFKSVNEFCGRTAGDELLKCIAEAFREHEGEHVVLSHFRADIFAMMTPFEEEEELIEIIRQISGRIREFKISCKVLPAFGICIATDNKMPVSLMQDYATMALKTVKGKFYANYAFFDEKMREQMLLEKQIENDIVDALETGQFRLFIQPKVDMETKEIIGGEALVRWMHPVKGIITPGEFIPVLEKNGFIINVDIYVWTEVFKFIGRRLWEGKSVVPISINISRLHVYDNSFRDCLVKLRDDYRVPPEYIPLELTESGFLETEEAMYENMKYLKAQGFTLSMDDFGTGYSTMTMLKNQPVDEIKIDKGFIEDLDNPKSKIVVSHTLSMLRDLNMDVIAEGVEEKEQQDFLVQCGCTKAQGFLYYKPMPIEQFEELIG